MTTTFEKPPLVELIVEVRWHAYGSQAFDSALPGSQLTFGVDTSQSIEDFFVRFGRACEELGFRSSERMTPLNAALPPGTVVYRYRENSGGTIMVQAGWGVVTVNAVPPYRSWADLRPRLENVLAAVTESRDDEHKESPFHLVSLRYIDAFSERYWKGKTAAEFSRDVLGFESQLPSAIESLRDETVAPQMALQIAFPLRDGMRARVAIGEGFADNTQAVIVDTMVSASDPVAPDLANLMNSLDGAHTAIVEMFSGMTIQIREEMEPREAVE